MRFHKQRHNHEGDEFRCDKCTFKTLHERKFQKHIQSAAHKENSGKYKCEYCGLHSAYLTRHIESVHHNKKYNCKHCSKEYKREDTLKEHEKNMHQTNLEEAIEMNITDDKIEREGEEERKEICSENVKYKMHQATPLGVDRVLFQLLNLRYT